MKYYALSWNGADYNLNIRSVCYDQKAHDDFSTVLWRGQRCEGLDFAGLDYLGGKKPRFEDMRFNFYGGYLVSERFREVVTPFLTSPNDVEWLYTPQRDDPQMPYPCHDRYYHFNVQRRVQPEDCLEKEYWIYEPTGKQFIKTLHFNPEAAAGAHVFVMKFELNNFFISEAVLKALKKAKLWKINVKDMPTCLKSEAYLYNKKISQGTKS